MLQLSRTKPDNPASIALLTISSVAEDVLLNMSTLRSCVSRFWHRARQSRVIVFELLAFLCGDVISICVCLRLRFGNNVSCSSSACSTLASNIR